MAGWGEGRGKPQNNKNTTQIEKAHSSVLLNETKNKDDGSICKQFGWSKNNGALWFENSV